MKKIGFGAVIMCWPLLFCSCSSAPPNASDPEWTRQSSRTIDNGYIVYVESTSASDSNRGRFLSEAQGLMDIRNECTLIPKGTRIEDRYERSNGHAHEVFVKVAVEFQECEQAKRAISTDEVQKYANIPMTEEVKRLEDEQKAPGASELAENEQDALAPGSTPNGVQYASNDTGHYYIVREQVAEDKQFIILHPYYYSTPVYAPPPPAGYAAAGAPPPPGPGAPPPAAPIVASHGPQVPPAGFDQQAMNQRLAERTQNVQQMEQAHPELRKQTQPWSQVRNNMVRNYKARADQARRSGLQRNPRPQSQPQQQQKSSGRRRRRQY